MVSDDFTALAAISMGTLTSSALTLALLMSLRDPEPVAAMPSEPEASGVVTGYVVSCAREPVVDFAIIRRNETSMVGPESPRTGWSPPPPEQLRILRAR